MKRTIDDRLNYGILPKRHYMLLLIGLMIIVMLISICLGRYFVQINDVIKILISRIVPIDMTWETVEQSVVMNLRLPRIVGAVLVGSALALSGATYQGIFKNPLVSPDLLGVSSGACVGAAVGILLHTGSFWIQILAFLGGLAAVGLTTGIPRLMRKSSAITLVLAGVIIGGFMNSLIGLLKYLADPETELAEMTYWQLGSIANMTYSDLLSVGPVIIVSSAVLLAMRWRINILSMGENEARTLGMNIRRERGLAILCATMMTASAVCISGTIGWIGLVIPHLARRLAGSDNRRVMPVSCALSGIFLIVIDTVARTLTGTELPLGILTGFIGAPFFAWIMIKERGDL